MSSGFAWSEWCSIDGMRFFLWSAWSDRLVKCEFESSCYHYRHFPIGLGNPGWSEKQDMLTGFHEVHLTTGNSRSSLVNGLAIRLRLSPFKESGFSGSSAFSGIQRFQRLAVKIACKNCLFTTLLSILFLCNVACGSYFRTINISAVLVDTQSDWLTVWH